MNESPTPNIAPQPLTAPLSRRAFLTGGFGLASVAAAGSLLRPDAPPQPHPESTPFSKQEAESLLASSAKSLQETILSGIAPKENSLAPMVTGALLAMPDRQIEKPNNTYTYLVPDIAQSIKNQYFDPTPDPEYLKQIAPVPEDNIPSNPLRRRILKTMTFSVATVVVEHIAQKTGILGKLFSKTKEALAHQIGQIDASPVLFNPDKVFTAPSPAATQDAASADQITPPKHQEPTPEVITPAIKEKIGDRNVAEFFLGDLVGACYRRRLERVANDPAAAERIQPELLHEKTLNFVYLGTDQTRERPNDGDIGRSDVVMFISFNPHTLQTEAASFPRDLFAPEVNAIKYGGVGLAGGRINGVTVAPFIDKSMSTVDLAKQIIESATGAPVDGVIQTNIDFMQGFEEKNIPSIFDNLFPDGLAVDVPKRIVDREYPAVNYATKTVAFEPGKQVLRGKRIVEYARTRHADSDFQRGDRQRQILFAAAKSFLPRIAQDILTDSTITLDTAITALEVQKTNKDISSDIDLAEVLKTIRSHVVSLRQSVSGTAALGVLAANTTGIIDALRSGNERMFAQFGINPATGAVGEKISTGAYQLPGANINARPTTNHNYLSYWEPLRERLKTFFLGNATETSIDLPPAPTPSKEERILHPNELSYDEVRPYIGTLRNRTDSVITESLFTKEVAAMPPAQRETILRAIAKAHAEALLEHYGDTETIVGLDPGHGGLEVGSTATKVEGGTLAEKNLNWEACQMIAEAIYNLTQGKYTVVFLRPENPDDQDINKDGTVSTIERLQKRKALLAKTEDQLRVISPWDKGKNIVYLSVHFNGSNDSSGRGTETFYPNNTATTDEGHRTSSKKLAEALQLALVAAIQETGYPTADRKAKEDPYTVTPTSHLDIGNPYIILDSPKLDWDLADKTKPYNKAT